MKVAAKGGLKLHKTMRFINYECHLPKINNNNIQWRTINYRTQPNKPTKS